MSTTKKKKTWMEFGNVKLFFKVVIPTMLLPALLSVSIVLHSFLFGSEIIHNFKHAKSLTYAKAVGIFISM